MKWNLGPNRADPLATGDEHAARKDMAINQRAATLAKCEAGGPFRITTYYDKKADRTRRYTASTFSSFVLLSHRWWYKPGTLSISPELSTL